MTTTARRLGAVRAAATARFPRLVGRPPAEVWLAARMLGWAIVLPVLKLRLPLDRLIRLMALDGGARAADPAQVATIARLARRTHRVVAGRRDDNCLERSLVAFRYLSAANADPQLVVGVRTDTGGGVEGHVWVTLGGQALHDAAADLATYTPVTTFRARGGRVERAAAP